MYFKFCISNCFLVRAIFLTYNNIFEVLFIDWFFDDWFSFFRHGLVCVVWRSLSAIVDNLLSITFVKTKYRLDKIVLLLFIDF